MHLFVKKNALRLKIKYFRMAQNDSDPFYRYAYEIIIEFH